MSKCSVLFAAVCVAWTVLGESSAVVTNPIDGPQAPDPCVVWDADTQYYYHLHTEHCRLELYRAKRIADILTSEHRTIYVTNAADCVYGDIWAPELHKAPNGKWYIYTSGRHLPDRRADKRLFIMESKTDDPYDGFVFKGMPTPDTFSIDPTVMTWTDGRQYICYSEVVRGRGQVLVLREMTDPWTFGPRQVEIAHAELAWEQKDGRMNEGPFFVRSPDGKRLFVVYSGNGCWHDDYALGVVEFLGGDLFDAKNWKKHPKQLLVKGNGVFGPGHATFFRSPDGTELWCAYHGLAKSNPSNTPTKRWLNVQRVSFDETGFPVMGEAIGAKPQQVPSGEPFSSASPKLIPEPRQMRVTGGWHRVTGSETFDRSMVTAFRSDAGIAKEGYRLVVTPQAIEVTSADEAGAFYAVETLKQLAEPREGALAVPCVEIEDAPRYGWRGVHLDECRHFFGKETVLRTLDLMASYKLNVFHWHLTDQGGWRLEVPGYPKLTEVGSVRNVSIKRNEAFWTGPTNTEKYGPYFYTAADVKEVLDYAAARHITVVPEIEEPAHCREALWAYPEFSCSGKGGSIFCTGNPATMKFLSDVYDYVAELFPSVYVHIGGDECPLEAWENCPKCKALREREGLKSTAAQRIWMTERFSEQLAAKGRRAVFWADQKESAYPKGAVVMSWIGASAGIEAAKRGLDVVMAPNGFCYFDYWQGVAEDAFCPRGENLVTPERVYAFDPCAGIPPEHRKHILGGQCCNWTEYTYDTSVLEWRLWPRTCAMAEVLWTAPERRDYAAFERRLAEHVVRLRRAGVNCAPIGSEHVLKQILDRYVREGRLRGFRTQMGRVTDVGGCWTEGLKPDNPLCTVEIYGGKLELIGPADETTLYEIRREYRRYAKIVMGM